MNMNSLGVFLRDLHCEEANHLMIESLPSIGDSFPRAFATQCVTCCVSPATFSQGAQFETIGLLDVMPTKA